MKCSVLAIAGLPGSGKSTLLNELRKIPILSSWQVTSTGDLLRGRHKFLLDNKSFNKDFVSYLNNLSDDEIIILNNMAHDLALKGNLILDSRYAVKNIDGIKEALVVFLTAPINIRIDRQKKSHPEKLTEEIKRDLEKREQWEFERGNSIYNYDYREHGKYHLVIDTSKFSIAEEVAAIMSLI